MFSEVGHTDIRVAAAEMARPDAQATRARVAAELRRLAVGLEVRARRLEGGVPLARVHHHLGKPLTQLNRLYRELGELL